MQAISQKGGRQPDEKEILIYYKKKKNTEFYGVLSIKGKSSDDFKWR